MKKIYLLAVVAIAMVFNANAQLDLDFDNLSAGDVVGQVPEIILWPAAGVTSSQVTSEQAFSGGNSVVTREQAGGLVDDILVQLGDQTNGVYSVSWMMYVPSGKTGFWNIQNAQDFTQGQWNGQFFVGATASGGSDGLITFDQDNTLGVPYPSDDWFSVIHVVDLGLGTSTLSINGQLLFDGIPYVDSNGGAADQLGAINFFAIDADNRYYIDDFRLVQGNLLNTNDFSAESFSVYPNPVRDGILYINSSSNVVSEVVVYDVLGKVVLQSRPDSISPSVDMSGLSSGAYMVKVSINGASKTIKVLK